MLMLKIGLLVMRKVIKKDAQKKKWLLPAI